MRKLIADTLLAHYTHSYAYIHIYVRAKINHPLVIYDFLYIFTERKVAHSKFVDVTARIQFAYVFTIQGQALKSV